MVRMLAFIPLATPVCSAGTAATTTPARLEKTRPEPTPWTVVAAYSCQVWSWNRPTQANAAPVRSSPVVMTARTPTRRIRLDGGEPDQEGGHRRGQQQVAGLGDRGAEAVAGLGRCLQQLWQEPERREHAEADAAGDHVGGPHAAAPHHVHVDHRDRHAELDRDPRGGQHHRDREQAEDPARRPAPLVALAQRDQQRDQPPGQQEGRADGQAGRRTHRRLGHEQQCRRGSDQGDHHRQPEQPLVAERVDDRTGHHDARRRSRPR